MSKDPFKKEKEDFEQECMKELAKKLTGDLREDFGEDDIYGVEINARDFHGNHKHLCMSIDYDKNNSKFESIEDNIFKFSVKDGLLQVTVCYEAEESPIAENEPENWMLPYYQSTYTDFNIKCSIHKFKKSIN